MKFLTSPYFYVPAIIIGGALLILWYRYSQCASNCPPAGVGAPCMPRKCNFFTGKPIVKDSAQTNQPNITCKPDETAVPGFAGGWFCVKKSLAPFI